MNTSKTVLKALGWSFIAFIVLGVISQGLKSVYSGQNHAVDNTVRSQIRMANASCPIPLANGVGCVSSITLEGNLVTYMISFQNDYYQAIERAVTNERGKEALLLSTFLLNAQNGKGDMMTELLINEGLGVKLIIESLSSSKHFECSLTADEFKTERAKIDMNPQEAMKRCLDIQVEITSAALPMEIDEGMTMTGYRLIDETIITTIVVDENLYSISQMTSNKPLIKEAMLEEGIKDPSSKATLDLCKISHTGLRYHIVGNLSHQSFDVDITSQEIVDFVETPSTLNIH